MNIWKILGIVIVTNVVAQSVISVAARVHSERIQNQELQMELQEKRKRKAAKSAKKRNKNVANLTDEEA